MGGCFGFSSKSALRHGEKVGPCTALALLRSHPSVFGRALCKHFSKIVALLLHADACALRQLSDEVPETALGSTLPEILQEIDSARLKHVLVPLVNADELRETVVALMKVVSGSCIVELLNSVPPEKLALVLRAPAEKLAALVAEVDTGRISVVLVPVLKEPEELLTGTLLPLLEQVHNPGRIAAVCNLVETDVLLWFLRGVPGDRLATLIDELGPEDFQAGGTAIALLQQLADERGLVREKVLPLIIRGEPAIMAQLIQGTSANNLLEVLRQVEVDGVLLLLENTNIDFVIRVFQGSNQTAVTATMAGGLAHTLTNPLAASTLKEVTDALNDTCIAADQANQRVLDYVIKAQQPVLDYVQRGKEQRGADVEEAYAFGDFTRGVAAELLDRSKGLSDSLQQELLNRGKAISESFEQNTQALRDSVKQAVQFDFAGNFSGTHDEGTNGDDIDGEDTRGRDMHDEDLKLQEERDIWTEEVAMFTADGAEHAQVLSIDQGLAADQEILQGHLEVLQHENPLPENPVMQIEEEVEAVHPGSQEDEHVNVMAFEELDTEDQDSATPVSEHELRVSPVHRANRQRRVDGCSVGQMLGPFSLPTNPVMPKLPPLVHHMGSRGREVLSDALDRSKEALSAGISVVKDAQQASVLKGLDCKRSVQQHKAAEAETEALFH